MRAQSLELTNAIGAASVERNPSFIPMTKSLSSRLAGLTCAFLALSGPCDAQLQTSGLAKPPAGGLSTGGESSIGLARGGPKRQRTELLALLTGAVSPSADRNTSPGTRIYSGVTYLMPLNEAVTQAGLAGKLQSGGRSAAVGFPDGFFFTEISADGQRRYASRMVTDQANRMVAVEFVATDPRLLPPPPEPLPPPTRSAMGRTYDFVPEGISAAGRRYVQQVWHMSDYVRIATRNGPKAADLYIPKPMVAIILHSLESSPGK